MSTQTWQEAVAEVWQLFKETDARLDTRFKETDEKIKQLSTLFTSQWGKLIEALVQPNALQLFQERGLEVRYVYQRVKSQQNGQTMELALLLENTRQAVVIEVKSTLRVSDVQDFLTDMERFLEFFPRYREYQVYGGVAGLDIVEDADRYAYRQGLFVLGVVGDGMVQIKNDEAFQPKDFARQ